MNLQVDWQNSLKKKIQSEKFQSTVVAKENLT